MPVSRFLIPLVSTVWIFSVMGGMGMHVLAEQPTEVQAVRRQFSTLEEVTAVQVQEVDGPLPTGGGRGSLRPLCGYDSGSTVRDSGRERHPGRPKIKSPTPESCHHQRNDYAV